MLTRCVLPQIPLYACKQATLTPLFSTFFKKSRFTTLRAKRATLRLFSKIFMNFRAKNQHQNVMVQVVKMLELSLSQKSKENTDLKFLPFEFSRQR